MREHPTTYSSAFFTPAGHTRRARRAQAKAARELTAVAKATQTAQARARLDAVKAERNAAAYLPAGGQSGPAALRSWRRFQVPAHRATSQVLAGAYPFLAEAGLGSAGTFIGHDAWSGSGFCFDPWVLYSQGVITNPNCLLAGVVGRGKSMLAKSMATRAIAFGRKVYVPGDPKASC